MIVKLFFYLMIINFIALPSLLLGKTQLIVGWHHFPPHQYLDKNKKLVGANIDLITKILNISGFKAKFREMPWKRNLAGLQNGTVDIAMSATLTNDRKMYSYFSELPLKYEYNVLFIRKSDKQKYSTLFALSDIIGTSFRLGVTSGAIYSVEYKELLNSKLLDKNISYSIKYEDNIRRLILNQIDGFIADELAGINTIKEYKYDKKLTILFYLYKKEEAEAYLMFSKKSMKKNDVEKINDAMKKMKKDGIYNKILNQYKLET